MVAISIIIPAYNASGYISSCLDSCLIQSFRNYEIIIINDGSIDNTEDIINTYISKYDNIHLISKKNEGPTKARKLGLRIAQGDFIFFLDADDKIEPHTLELLYSYSKEYDIIIGNIVIEDENGEKYKIQHHNTLKYENDKEGMLLNYLEKCVTPSLCCRLIKRTLFDNIDVPERFTIGDDVITNIMIVIKNNVKVYIVDDILYHYIQHLGSIVNTYNEKTLIQRSKYVIFIISLLYNEKISNKLNKSLSVFVLNEYYSFLRYGGNKNIDKYFTNIVRTKFWDKTVIKEMSIWKILMLYSFEISNKFGELYRSLFFYLRNKM